MMMTPDGAGTLRDEGGQVRKPTHGYDELRERYAKALKLGGIAAVEEARMRRLTALLLLQVAERLDILIEELETSDRGCECLLQTTEHCHGSAGGGWPRDLRCSNCGYTAEYFFWYATTGYQNRRVDYCPHCGMRICAAVAS